MTSITSKQALFWQQHVEAHKASRLSRRVYCAQHGLKEHQLTYYIGRLGKPSSNKTAFAQVVVEKTSEPSIKKPFMARLIFNSHVVLELDSTADISWLAKLISEVGGQQ